MMFKKYGHRKTRLDKCIELEDFVTNVKDECSGIAIPLEKANFDVKVKDIPGKERKILIKQYKKLFKEHNEIIKENNGKIK